MDSETMLRLLQQVAAGEIPPDLALERLQAAPFARTVSGLSLDLHRQLRTGLPEVVFAPGKSDTQLCEAVACLAGAGQPVLVTRCAQPQLQCLAAAYPQGQVWEAARLFCLGGPLLQPEDGCFPNQGELLCVTAGGADLPIALEAMGTARFLGLSPGLISDVGVAGLHRVEPHLSALRGAKLLLVFAGMEGALPSVLGGLCSTPIIAVPTSIGYGASFQGLAALLAMLNSCAPGVSVVNIDNGFGGAVMAWKLLNKLG